MLGTRWSGSDIQLKFRRASRQSIINLTVLHIKQKGYLRPIMRLPATVFPYHPSVQSFKIINFDHMTGR